MRTSVPEIAGAGEEAGPPRQVHGGQHDGHAHARGPLDVASDRETADADESGVPERSRPADLEPRRADDADEPEGRPCRDPGDGDGRGEVAGAERVGVRARDLAAPAAVLEVLLRE